MGYELNNLLAQFGLTNPGQTTTMPQSAQYDQAQFHAPGWTPPAVTAPVSEAVAAPAAAAAPAASTGGGLAGTLSYLSGIGPAPASVSNSTAVPTGQSTDPNSVFSQLVSKYGVDSQTAYDLGAAKASGLLSSLQNNDYASANTYSPYFHFGQSTGERSLAQAARGGSISSRLRKYADGGGVLPSDGELVATPDEIAQRADDATGMSDIYPNPPDQSMFTDVPPAATIGQPGPAAPQMPPALSKYGSKPIDMSGDDVSSARKRYLEQSKAFMDKLNEAMNNPEQEKLSKEEMYWRLAAAFGSPTRTGGLMENVSLAGTSMAEFDKEQRAAAQNKIQLEIAAQKFASDAAKGDLDAAVKDKTNMARLQERQGNFDQQMQFKLDALKYKEWWDQHKPQTTAAAKANQLSGTEKKDALDTSAKIQKIQTSLQDLEEADKLSKNALSNNPLDQVRYHMGLLTGSNDPVITATASLDNLLKTRALSNLKETFGARPSTVEMQLQQNLAGAGSASPSIRSAIINRTRQHLQDQLKYLSQHLNDINSGAFHTMGALQPVIQQSGQ